MKIGGGYVLWARKEMESEIAKKSPCFRETWRYLWNQANHSDHKGIRRGSLVRTIKNIRNDLCWYVGYRKMTYSKDQCENAMKWLRSRAMITTTKTTRGMVIEVLKYNDYQNPKNYEGGYEDNNEDNKKTTTLPNDKQELKNYKNDKKRTNTTKSSLRELNINHIMVLYQKKFPEQRKLYGMGGVVRTREYFESIIESGFTHKDIEIAINKAINAAPWNIIKPKKPESPLKRALRKKKEIK